jgi:hypothetical protein
MTSLREVRVRPAAVSRSPAPAEGTVVGRISSDELYVLTEAGWRFSVRVSKALGSQLEIGERVQIVLGPDLWPKSLRPLAA